MVVFSSLADRNSGIRSNSSPLPRFVELISRCIVCFSHFLGVSSIPLSTTHQYIYKHKIHRAQSCAVGVIKGDVCVSPTVGCL